MVSIIAWQDVSQGAVPTLNRREKVAACSEPNPLTRAVVSDGPGIVS